MGRMKAIAISLDAMTPQDWADVGDALREAGIDAATVDWADVAGMPVVALAALVHVTVRRENPHATHTNSYRLALAAQGA